VASKANARARPRNVPTAPTAPAGRASRAGPVRLAFTRAVQDWWYGLIPFAVLNLLWLLLVLTVVAGPPATAAMLGVARDAAVGEGAEPRNFFIYLRQFFWRAWRLGLVTLLGSVILVTDLGFFAGATSGSSILLKAFYYFLLYALIVWFEFLLIAWPLLVNQPEMSIRDIVRNAGILTLRMPGANFGLALLVLLIFVFSFFLAIAISLALAALVALLVQHYLHIQAPVLANFPPRPGEGPVARRPARGLRIED
jgi:uncharacterized membrane protein YesL